MSCPCNPELIAAAAAPVQLYLDGMFAWSVFLTLCFDPLYSLVLLGTAFLLAAQQSYLLSAWYFVSALFAALLVAGFVFRRIKGWLEERRLKREILQQEIDNATELAAYEAYCNEQNDNKPKEK
jgi:hypothetical protein